MKDIQAFILTGGKSSRMGKDKSNLHFGGMKFTEHLIHNLSKVSASVSIVGPEDNFEKYNGPFIKDIFEDKGPAAGILAALRSSNSDLNIIVSCDIPLLKVDLIKGLLDSYTNEDAIICETKGRLHPLVGIYHKRCENAFQSAIENNTLKISSILEKVFSRTYIVPNKWEDQLTNINSPEQYKKLIDEYSH